MLSLHKQNPGTVLFFKKVKTDRVLDNQIGKK